MKANILAIQKLVDWINNTPEKTPSAQEASQSVNYERSYLSKLFKRTTGITYNEYSNIIKMGFAAAELRNTTKTVFEISEMLDYSAPEAFNHAFTNAFGCSPTDYRRNPDSISVPFCKIVSNNDKGVITMDEADKLADGGQAADFGLFQAATLGREYGLQILLTTQSIENLYGLAPGFNEHIARGGLSGFPVLLSFRPGDATTISTLQTLFGSRRHDITTMPLSRYDHPMVKSEIEPVVSEADFAQLDTGEAYIKIKSAPPQKVSIILEEC